MTMQTLIVVLLVGAAAGWTADRFATGKGFGTTGDAVVGVVGAFVGVVAAQRFGVEVYAGIYGTVVHAAAGAVVLLLLARLSQSGGLFSGAGTSATVAAKPAPARTATTGPVVRPVRPEPRTGR